MGPKEGTDIGSPFFVLPERVKNIEESLDRSGDNLFSFAGYPSGNAFSFPFEFP
jgi:hypothetical protein